MAEWTDNPGNQLRHAGGSVIAATTPTAGQTQLTLAFLGPAKYADGTAASANDRIAGSAHDYKAADGIHQTGAFGDPEQWRFDWERSYTQYEWLDQLPTFGGHNQLPPAKLKELLAGVGAAIDAVGGRFTMRHTAAVVTAARTDRA